MITRMVDAQVLRVRVVYFALSIVAAVLASSVAVHAAAEPISEVQSPHGAFRDACQTCHVAEGWQTATSSDKFDHGRYGFDLEGAHSGTECLFCHDTLEFERVSSDCSDCHQDIHQGRLGVDCSACHGTRTFVDRTHEISMHRETRFPLSGAHSTLDCDQCHKSDGSGVEFVNTDTGCFSCHSRNYTATRAPNHMNARFGFDCTECHNMVSWSGGTFSGTHAFFPLQGGHASLDCMECHRSGQFSAIDDQCIACHRVDYDGTTDPAHLSAGFGTQCQACHGTATWTGAAFDHDASAFPLTGAHRAVACTDCHVGGRFTGTSTRCYDCHSSEYAATSNPSHVPAGFSTDCEVCHGSSTWSGARFDHGADFFPIYSGAHRGKWSDCQDCHSNPANYGTFSCFGCHPHSDKNKTDRKHRGKNGYRYDSVACFDCHPRGRS